MSGSKNWAINISSKPFNRFVWNFIYAPYIWPYENDSLCEIEKKGGMGVKHIFKQNSKKAGISNKIVS